MMTSSHIPAEESITEVASRRLQGEQNQGTEITGAIKARNVLNNLELASSIHELSMEAEGIQRAKEAHLQECAITLLRELRDFNRNSELVRALREYCRVENIVIPCSKSWEGLGGRLLAITKDGLRIGFDKRVDRWSNERSLYLSS
jgi:hypothetical protein